MSLSQIVFKVEIANDQPKAPENLFVQVTQEFQYIAGRFYPRKLKLFLLQDVEYTALHNACAYFGREREDRLRENADKLEALQGEIKRAGFTIGAPQDAQEQ